MNAVRGEAARLDGTGFWLVQSPYELVFLSIPPLIVFLIFQKNFVRGIA